MDELLDLVNDNDEVIGTKLRSEVYAEGLKNFRVVNAMIVNDKGELWIPRRAAHKKIFPLGLDMSMGGHVESGEGYDETFRRETAEELNLDVTTVPIKLLGKLTPHEDGVSAFQQVYEIKLNEAPAYNPDDYISYEWLTPQALLNQLASGEKSKDDLPIIVKKFYV
jgi:isopentenyldiphosphate isomerase